MIYIRNRTVGGFIAEMHGTASRILIFALNRREQGYTSIFRNAFGEGTRGGDVLCSGEFHIMEKKC